MNSKKLFRLRSTIKGAAFAFVLCIGFVSDLQAQQRVVIRGVHVFDGKNNTLLRSVDMAIEEDLIVDIYPTNSKQSTNANAETIITKYKGKFIIPGLITAHSHLGQTDGIKRGPANFTRENITRQLEQYRKSGVTSIVSLGTNLPLIYEIRDSINNKELLAPRIFSADAGIGAVMGPPDAMTINNTDKIFRPTNLAEAKLAVQQAHASGTDYIKMWVDSRSTPSIPVDIAAAIIAEAHHLDLKVFAHVYTLSDAKMLVNADVDVIAHGIRDQPVDPEFIQLMKSKGTWYIPTLALDEAFYIYSDEPNWVDTDYFKTRVQPELFQFIRRPEWIKETKEGNRAQEARHAVLMNQRNLMALHSAGIPLAFGTDSGAFPLRVPGIAEHREIELMVAAGMENHQALEIATSQTAKLLGLETTGEIALGKLATFVVLEENPLEDITALRTIGDVWISGEGPN